MRYRAVRMALAASALALPAVPAGGQEAELVNIRSARGADQAFILIKPEAPVASVVLFAGGRGRLDLTSATTMAWGGLNFLVRVRKRFAEQGLMVAVVDAPSDRAGIGMPAWFRMTSHHAVDIDAVVGHLRKQADVPVWLVGTSLGTFSAANGAITLKSVDGLVLASTTTRARPHWSIRETHPDAVMSMNLPAVSVPTLIVSHKDDGCFVTPAEDSEKLAKRFENSRKVEVAIFEGGTPTEDSEPCGPTTQHGFHGIEGQVVERIANFIKAGY